MPTPRSEAASAATLVRLFQSETAEIDNAPEPDRTHSTILIAALMFVALLVIAILMPVDRVVQSGFGQIVTVDPTIVLQAFDQALIKTLDVKAGDRVKKGALLATLDPTISGADVNALKAQVASDEAQIARGEAELAQRPYSPDTNAGPYAALQKTYYEQRKAQYDAQIRSYDEQVAQLKASTVKLETDMARYGDRASISTEIEKMRATLAADQYGSRLNLLLATDQKTELLRQVDYDRNALAETKHQMASTVATKEAYIQQWFAQVSSELVTAGKDRDNAREQLTKALLHQGLVRIEAPEDAVVLSVAKLSVGSVLTAGTPLYNLAPLKSEMEAEAHVSPLEIGFVRVGDPTTIKLDSFYYVEHGVAQGTVKWISDGAFTVDDNNQPTPAYYKVRVAIHDINLRNVPQDFRLIPGMTLVGDIHVGSRSLIMYLLRGIVRGFDEAMREP